MTEERVQRRLAAILAADVVGYSRLMRADEAGTLAQLKVLRKEVFDPRTGEHNGRIVKTMGDGVLVEFPSAVDATQCAIKVQRALSRRNEDVPQDHRVELRIGINLGDIVVDGEDIFGDGVNVAARLEGLCDAGEVYISAAIHDLIVDKVTAAFDDLGEHTFKNIDKPIRVYRVSQEIGGSSSQVVDADPDQLLLLPDKPSIAVLAFENMSGDPEQEYFSDGIAEDIITALSRARWLRVVSRNSAFAYKGLSTNIRRLADDLGVRYVLEGSVRKSGERVRITAQLIDAATDRHLWAERFDREIGDLFEVQDEITGAISGRIEPEMRKAEIERARISRPDSTDTWEIYQRGMWHMWRLDQRNFLQALELFRQVNELDPNFAFAYSGRALACFFMVHFGLADDSEMYIDEGMIAAKQAVELDGNDGDARTALGGIYHLRRDFKEAVDELETSIRLHPLDCLTHIILARTLLDMGRFSDSLAVAEKALRISPNDPQSGIVMARVAEANFFLRQFEQAAEWARKAMRQSMVPRIWGPAVLVAALGHSGDTEGAENALAELLSERPEFSLGFVRENYPIRIPEHLEFYLDGLKIAGVPE